MALIPSPPGPLSSASFGLNDDYSNFFNGAASSDLVPKVWNVSIGGHNYLVDFTQPFYRQIREQKDTLIRTQADTGDNPGEQTMDPNGLWRRSLEDWSFGAGQRYLDRKQSGDISSLPNAFWQSKGLDFSSKWQATLLPDTENSLFSTDTNPIVLNVGGTIYVSHGETLEFSTTYPYTTWTTVTGTPADAISSMCTDGFNVWIACGAGGVYTTTQGASAATQYVTSALSKVARVAYVNNRLMIGGSFAIFNIIASGVLPAALYQNGNENFFFNSFASGPVGLYVAGNICGQTTPFPLLDQGIIYMITIDTTGETLDPPSIAGVLPNGETVASIYQYLGNLVVLTSRGVRFCQIGSDGGITLGSLITVPSPAYNSLTHYQMTGDGNLAYFPWTDYDSGSTGIGAINLSYFVVSPVLPAYYSHLMSPSDATTQGTVTSIAYDTLGNLMFTVAGVGLMVQTADLVPSGTVDSGFILYDLVDNKVATAIDTRTEGPLTAGSYEVFISTDAGPFESVGSCTLATPPPVSFGINATAERFEVRVQLNRDATNPTTGPVFTRWTLRSWPAPNRPLTWQLPLKFSRTLRSNSGSEGGFDVVDELNYLYMLLDSGTQVLFQRGDTSYLVYVSDIAFLPLRPDVENDFFEGLVLISLQGIPGD
jgi:hypothetical protein